MWQRFSIPARNVIFCAQEEAQSRGHGLVTTAHLLLGLLAESEAVGRTALVQLGADADQVRSAAERSLASVPRGAFRDITLSPDGKQAIDQAYVEMKSLRDNGLHTEHLLLGLLKVPNGPAYPVLATVGIGYEAARRQVEAMPDRAAME